MAEEEEELELKIWIEEDCLLVRNFTYWPQTVKVVCGTLQYLPYSALLRNAIPFESGKVPFLCWLSHCFGQIIISGQNLQVTPDMAGPPAWETVSPNAVGRYVVCYDSRRHFA